MADDQRNLVRIKACSDGAVLNQGSFGVGSETRICEPILPGKRFKYVIVYNFSSLDVEVPDNPTVFMTTQSSLMETISIDRLLLVRSSKHSSCCLFSCRKKARSYAAEVSGRFEEAYESA